MAGLDEFWSFEAITSAIRAGNIDVAESEAGVIGLAQVEHLGDSRRLTIAAQSRGALPPRSFCMPCFSERTPSALARRRFLSRADGPRRASHGPTSCARPSAALRGEPGELTSGAYYWSRFELLGRLDHDERTLMAKAARKIREVVRVDRKRLVASVEHSSRMEGLQSSVQFRDDAQAFEQGRVDPDELVRRTRVRHGLA